MPSTRFASLFILLITYLCLSDSVTAAPRRPPARRAANPRSARTVYRQTTRQEIIARNARPAGAKRAGPSDPVYPISTCSRASTGLVPYAVFKNYEATGNLGFYFNVPYPVGDPDPHAFCLDLCGSAMYPTCYAVNTDTRGTCQGFERSGNVGVNTYQTGALYPGDVGLRAQTCDQVNAPELQGVECCTSYRAS